MIPLASETRLEMLVLYALPSRMSTREALVLHTVVVVQHFVAIASKSRAVVLGVHKPTSNGKTGLALTVKFIVVFSRVKTMNANRLLCGEFFFLRWDWILKSGSCLTT